MNSIVAFALAQLELWLALSCMAAILAGWGRLTARLLGLPRAALVHALDLWLGFVAIVVLSYLVHFLLPLNWMASATFAAIGIAALGMDGIEWKEQAKQVWRALAAHRVYTLLAVLLLLLVGAQSFRQPYHYDSGLYHLQSIRWLNEYAIVPGLGNLHGRLAFNQSYFNFIALVNVFPYWNKGYAVASVFLLLLATVTVLQSRLHEARGGTILVLALLAIMFKKVYVISAPSPDTAIAILQGMIFVGLLQIALRKETRAQPDARLFIVSALLCATVVSVKLSALVYAAMCFPVFWLLAWRHGSEGRGLAWKSLGLSVIFGAAYIASGYITSGVPLFPSTFAGAWGLEWAVPEALVRGEADWIYSWARHQGLPPEQVLGNWDWLPFWVKNFPMRGWLCLGSSLVFAVLAMALARRRREASGSHERNIWLLFLPLLAAVVFWFFTAPDIRFLGLIAELLAVFSIWLFVRQMLSAGLPAAVYRPLESLAKVLGVSAILALACVRIGFFPGWQQLHSARTETRTTDSGVKVLVPVIDTDSDQCWNAPLPCTPYFSEDLDVLAPLDKSDFQSGFRKAR